MNVKTDNLDNISIEINQLQNNLGILYNKNYYRLDFLKKIQEQKISIFFVDTQDILNKIKNLYKTFEVDLDNYDNINNINNINDNINNNMLTDITGDYITECNRECCSFQ